MSSTVLLFSLSTLSISHLLLYPLLHDHCPLLSLWPAAGVGHYIHYEIEVAYPAAKNIVELDQVQNEECGDGMTNIIIFGASDSLCLYTTTTDLYQLN